MGRSRSRSGCRRVPVSVYCGRVKKSRSRRRGHRSRRGRLGKRRRSRSRRGRCGSRRRGFGKRRSRRRSRKSRRSRRRRTCRPGIQTKNPFLNYLRVFRKKHCGWPQYKIAIEGAKCWCKMNNQERQRFYDEACSMRKGRGRRGRKRRHRGRSRRRGRCGKRRRSRKSRPKRSVCPM